MSGAQVAREGNCPRHPSKQAIYLCDNCDNTLACGDCVVSCHQGHKLVKATDFIASKRERFQSFVSRMQDEIVPAMKANLTSADDRKLQKRRELGQQTAAIRLKGEQLKDEIDNKTEELIQECESAHDKNIQRLENYTSQIQSILANCYKQIAQLQEIIPTLSVESILGVIGLNINQNFEIQEPKLIDYGFKPVEDPLKNINNFGKMFLKDNEMPHEDLQELSTFTHTSGITLLHSTKNGKAWTSYSENKNVQVLDPSGAVKEYLKTTFIVDSCCVSPTTGSLWIGTCSSNVSEVYEISEGTSTAKFKFKPVVNMTMSICIQRDSTVLLGSLHGITAYSPSGKEICSTQFPRKKSEGAFGMMMYMFKPETKEKPRGRVVTWPRSIRESSVSGDLAVVDWDTASHSGSGKPHIVVLDSNLELKFRYHGMEIPLCGAFKPYDACYDDKNNLVIADHDNKSIDLVSGENGCFLRTLSFTHLCPKSVSLTKNILWVALQNRNVKVLKYCT